MIELATDAEAEDGPGVSNPPAFLRDDSRAMGVGALLLRCRLVLRRAPRLRLRSRFLDLLPPLLLTGMPLLGPGLALLVVVVVVVERLAGRPRPAARPLSASQSA